MRSEAGRGLDASGRASLSAEVALALGRVHEQCARRGSRPADLPAPSRNAYRFLKGLDLDRMVVGSATLRPALKVRAVVATAERLIATLVSGDADPGGVAAEARAAVETVTDLLSRRGRDASSLPTRSRAAFTTLERLGDVAAADSLRTTTRALTDLLETGFRRRWPRDPRPVSAMFAPCSVLWRWHGTRDRATLTVSVQFLDAPSEVLEHMVRWCLGGDRGRGRRAVDAWLLSRAQARPRAAPVAAPASLVHDLEAMFHEVNRDHFAGRLSRPRIEWTSRPTVSKFGHYTYADDRLVLSASLDQPAVPREVVRYVLFHELLHKDLGESGSCRGHGREFRKREREFPGYDAAVAELDRLANALRRRACGAL